VETELTEAFAKFWIQVVGGRMMERNDSEALSLERLRLMKLSSINELQESRLVDFNGSVTRAKFTAREVPEQADCRRSFIILVRVRFGNGVAIDLERTQ